MDQQFEEKFVVPLEAACQEAMKVVANQYFGRYVARVQTGDGSAFVVLDHDDPDRLEEDQDAFAHVTEEGVWALGHARNYLNTDGTVDRSYFSR